MNNQNTTLYTIVGFGIHLLLYAIFTVLVDHFFFEGGTTLVICCVTSYGTGLLTGYLAQGSNS